MTYEEANFVKHLAKPCYKAIKAIAGERECRACIGNRISPRPPKERYKCSLCNGTGKVGWKWEPTIGDKVCRSEMILFYAGIIPAIDGKRAGKFISDAGTEYEWPIDVVTPILPWETIEGILEEVGYWLQIGRPHAGGLAKTQCMINEGDKANSVVCVRGKSRQEAVMLAVIELSKRR